VSVVRFRPGPPKLNNASLVRGIFHFDDPEHSDNEERFILLGLSHSLHVILVCHCYRSEDDVIRIISVRKATPRESKAY
jgi:uncharacterized DUF497 family protein